VFLGLVVANNLYHVFATFDYDDYFCQKGRMGDFAEIDDGTIIAEPL